MKCKCKGCTERKVNCHSKCVDYRRYKMELKDTKEKIKMNKELNALSKK